MNSKLGRHAHKQTKGNYLSQPKERLLFRKDNKCFCLSYIVEFPLFKTTYFKHLDIIFLINEYPILSS